MNIKLKDASYVPLERAGRVTAVLLAATLSIGGGVARAQSGSGSGSKPANSGEWKIEPVDMSKYGPKAPKPAPPANPNPTPVPKPNPVPPLVPQVPYVPSPSDEDDLNAAILRFRAAMRTNNFYVFNTQAVPDLVQHRAVMPQASHLGPGGGSGGNSGQGSGSGTGTQALKLSAAGGASIAGFNIGQSDQKWINIGPDSLRPPYNSHMGQGYIAGRANGVAYDLTDPSGATAYVAAAGGGLWKTVDNGLTWKPMGDNIFPQEQTTCVAVSPVNGHVLYVGLGDFNTGGIAPGATYGNGIMRSNNGGVTWVNVGSTQMAGTPVSAITIDPDSPLTIMAATGHGTAAGMLWRSGDGGNTWTKAQLFNGSGSSVPNGNWSSIAVGQPDPNNGNIRPYYATLVNDGVYFSMDQGVTWSKITSLQLIYNGNPNAPVNGSDALFVSASSFDPYTVYILDAAGGYSDGRVFKSSNFNNTVGALVPQREGTWREITGDLLTNAGTGNNWATIGRAGMLAATPDPSGAQDLLYAGARTLSGSLSVGGDEVLWTDISRSIGSGVIFHVDQHALSQSPNRTVTTSTGTVPGVTEIVATDGGVYRTKTTDGATWNSPSSPTDLQLNQHLPIMQFNGAAFSTNNPDVAVGGTFNNGLAFRTSAGTWMPATAAAPLVWYNIPSPYADPGLTLGATVLGDTVGAVAIEPGNPANTTQYAIVGGHVLLTTDQWNSAIEITPNQTLKDLGAGQRGVIQNAVDANNASPLYLYPYYGVTSSTLASDWNGETRSPIGVLTVSQFGTHPMYTGGGYLWRYDRNIAETLPAPGPTAPAYAIPANGRWRKLGTQQLTSGGVITAITIAPNDATGKVIYVGTSDGQVWLTQNANNFDPTSGASTATWTKVSNASLPARQITGISVNPNAAPGTGLLNTDIIVSLGGVANPGEGSVYRCANTTAANPFFTNQSGALTGAASLPNVPANGIVRDPDDPVNTWYLATDFGVFTTVDGGSNWSDATTPLGLPNVECTALDIFPHTAGGTDKRLNIATFGRGMWQFKITGTSVTTPAQLSASPALSRTGGQIFVTLNISNAGAAAANVQLTAASVTTSTGGTTTATNSTLPISVGTIGNGLSKTVTVTFPGTVGTLGTSVTLNATLTYVDGLTNTVKTFNYTSTRTRLP